MRGWVSSNVGVDLQVSCLACGDDLDIVQSYAIIIKEVSKGLHVWKAPSLASDRYDVVHNPMIGWWEQLRSYVMKIAWGPIIIIQVIPVCQCFFTMTRKRWGPTSKCRIWYNLKGTTRLLCRWLHYWTFQDSVLPKPVLCNIVSTQVLLRCTRRICIGLAAEIEGWNMATPTTNLSKGVPMNAAHSRNAERETRRPASEGCVINDIVDASVVIDERSLKRPMTCEFEPRQIHIILKHLQDQGCW